MVSMKLLLVFAVLTGIFVDKCDLGDFALSDFANNVKVTNLSDEADAFVSVRFNHGARTIGLEAGKSATVFSFAATKYTIVVAGQTDGGYISYKDTLTMLREQLVKLTLTRAVDQTDVSGAAAELLTVQAALGQLTSEKLQSCSGKILDEGVNQATVKLTTLTDGSKVWSLDCH